MPKKPHIFLRAQVSICHQWAWSARFHPTVYFAFDFFNPSYLDQILDSCNRNNNLNILSLVRNIKKVLLMFGEAGPVGSAREMNNLFRTLESLIWFTTVDQKPDQASSMPSL